MYKDYALAMKRARAAAKTCAVLEAKASAFDKIKALVESPDQDGVLAKIRDIVKEEK